MSNLPIRVGRSEAVSLFWGLASACFASAACYYYLQNLSNEKMVRLLRDSYSTRQEQVQSLEGEKSQLRTVKSEEENLLVTRDEVLKEKENVLTQKEIHLESLEQQNAEEQKRLDSQIELQKKFTLLAGQLINNDESSLALRFDNRPVLRLPNTRLFDFNATTLNAEGRILLTKLAQALNGQLEQTELCLEVYADSHYEMEAPAPDKDKPREKSRDQDKIKPLSAWEITTARAQALQRFFKDEGTLPNEHIFCVGRGDINPLTPANAPDAGTKNRRTEITLLPLARPLPPGSVILSAPSAITKASSPDDMKSKNAPLAPPPDKP